MKLKNPMLVVTDIDKSVEFYKKVFGLHVIMDFGANKTLTGGLALQTVETYEKFIGTTDISFGGNNFELYFEEDDFDKFAEKLKEYVTLFTTMDIDDVNLQEISKGDLPTNWLNAAVAQTGTGTTEIEGGMSDKNARKNISGSATKAMNTDDSTLNALSGLADAI